MNNDDRIAAPHAFAHALRVQRDAALLGFDWPEISGVVDKVSEETDELRTALAAGDETHAASELGDLFFAAVSVARFLNANPERCLYEATRRFQLRLELVKKIAVEREFSLTSCTMEELDRLWEEAKQLMRQQLEKGLDK